MTHRMIPLAIPLDESSRLDTLRALKNLDAGAEDRFDRLTRIARRLFGVPMVLLNLVDADRQRVKPSQGASARQIPREASFWGHAIIGDDILVVPDTRLDVRFHDNALVLGDPKVRFYAGCPMKLPGGEKLGTLSLIDVQPRTMDETDLALLRDMTRLAAQEIIAVQLATIDELTQLPNRRGFLSLGQHALGLCSRRMERPTAMLNFNLDGFKSINDRFGHAEGDRALASFAALLVKTFRDSDVIGRLGGDEFAVLMPSCSHAECEIAKQRLQQTVDEYNRSSQRGYELQFSVGETSYEPIRHSAIDSLLSDANASMYEGKRQKRTA